MREKNKNGTKITILGAGNVGASIAYTFAVAGTCSDIVLVDINKAKAKGEAMDIRQGVSFGENVEVFDGEYEDAKDSDIVVVTLGIARKPGQTRLDLAQINVNIIKEWVILVGGMNANGSSRRVTPQLIEVRVPADRVPCQDNLLLMSASKSEVNLVYDFLRNLISLFHKYGIHSCNGEELLFIIQTNEDKL